MITNEWLLIYTVFAICWLIWFTWQVIQYFKEKRKYDKQKQAGVYKVYCCYWCPAIHENDMAAGYYCGIDNMINISDGYLTPDNCPLKSKDVLLTFDDKRKTLKK
jgi:hypothetical protein